MKKSISLLLLAIALFFCSCKDNNEFVTQLFTNDQISGALQQCADSTVMRTVDTLCVVGTVKNQLGFSYYKNGAYRITLPPEAKSITDTLENYDQAYKAIIDTLIVDMNRAAEQCGEGISQFWVPVIQATEFPDPNLILHGGNGALTNYLKQTQQIAFMNILTAYTLKEQFDALHIIERWNTLQRTYFELTGKYSSIDILDPAVQQVTSGFFTIMALEEEAIRKNPPSNSGLLYKVFKTL